MKLVLPLAVLFTTSLPFAAAAGSGDPAALTVPPAPPAPAAPPVPPQPRADPFAGKLFPPELIMGHQQELKIDDKQREAIINAIQKVQASMVSLQWQLQAATEELGTILDATPVDEAKAAAQATKVMDLEREAKKGQLLLLIRIKNTLSAEQIARLRGLAR